MPHENIWSSVHFSAMLKDETDKQIEPVPRQRPLQPRARRRRSDLPHLRQRPCSRQRKVNLVQDGSTHARTSGFQGRGEKKKKKKKKKKILQLEQQPEINDQKNNPHPTKQSVKNSVKIF
jgi:hypothetical protein